MCLTASRSIYDNSHTVGMDLLKEIATFARSSFDFNKPIRLIGLRFTRVTLKQEWMNRALENILFTKYPATLEELIRIYDLNEFCCVQAMDIHAINSETVNIHYTAHQFWEQEGPRSLLIDISLSKSPVQLG